MDTKQNKLVRLRSLLKDFFEEEENKNLHAFGLFLCADSEAQLGFCMTPGKGLDLYALKNKFKSFTKRNMKEKDSINHAVTLALFMGIIEAMAEMGYVHVNAVDKNIYDNSMAN